MNRAERRRLKKQDKVRTYNMNHSQIKDMKEDATKKAIHAAFTLMLAIPVMVIHDKYPQLMKREVDGKSREERFAEMILDLYDSYDKGYVTFEDLVKCLEEETGMKVGEQK